MELRKWCPACREEKPLSEFWWRDKEHTQLSYRCKECHRRYQRERLRRAEPQVREIKRQRRRAWGIRRFGITVDQYDAMLKAQEERCAICRQAETHTYRGKIRPLTIDHDHETGAVRGLLCSKCNLAVGLMADDPGRLEDAAAYLREAAAPAGVAHRPPLIAL